MLIKTSDIKSVKSILNKLKFPKPDSHKGHNGKVLIIGGSSLFHSASIWAAEVASHFSDMVHYSSTKENEEIILSLKKQFHNGIVVPQEKLLEYVKEDDAILVGPGMMREGEEGKYTLELTKSLIEKFPDKQFVFDAGALQLMDPDWLLEMKKPAIITPHQKEFEKLFGTAILELQPEEKMKTVEETAKKYRVVILLKAIIDIISDGKETYVVEGGNAGLTKGGTGDVLAGLTTALSAVSDPFISAVSASIILKKTSERLFLGKGYWYNVDNLIELIPEVLRSVITSEAK